MATTATLFADGFSEDPWWWGDAPPVAYDADPPTRSDVDVVGGCYAGLSCATELALAGRSVAVLDIQCIGEGASGRNAGLVSGRAGISKMIDLESYVGPDRAAAILDEADEAYVHFQHLVDEHAPGAFQDRGRFVAARSKAAFRKLEKKYEEYRDSGEGSGVTLIQPGDEGRLSPPMRSTAGWRRAPPVWPTRRVHRWPSSPRRGRGRVDPHGHPVTDIDSSGVGPHTITVASGSGTARGHRRIAAGDVVIATNGYTDRVVPWHRERIVPMSSTILGLERLGRERVEALLPAMTAVIDTNRVIVYARPTPDGEGILFGGRARFRPYRRRRRLGFSRPDARDLPDARRCEDQNAWSGLMAFTADYSPSWGCAIGCITSSVATGLRGRIDAVARSSGRASDRRHRRSDPADVVARGDSL